MPRIVTLIRYPPLANVSPGGCAFRLPVKPKEGGEDMALAMFRLHNVTRERTRCRCFEAVGIVPMRYNKRFSKQSQSSTDNG